VRFALKSAKNAEERELPFDLTADLDWSAAQIIETDTPPSPRCTAGCTSSSTPFADKRRII
jgi:hypothetical protein